MEELEAFSIRVAPDTDRPDRFRWLAHAYGKLRFQSEDAFDTSGDAALAAVRAIEKRRSASITAMTERSVGA